MCPYMNRSVHGSKMGRPTTTDFTHLMKKTWESPTGPKRSISLTGRTHEEMNRWNVSSSFRLFQAKHSGSDVPQSYTTHTWNLTKGSTFPGLGRGSGPGDTQTQENRVWVIYESRNIQWDLRNHLGSIGSSENRIF